MSKKEEVGPLSPENVSQIKPFLDQNKVSFEVFSDEELLNKLKIEFESKINEFEVLHTKRRPFFDSSKAAYIYLSVEKEHLLLVRSILNKLSLLPSLLSKEEESILTEEEYYCVSCNYVGFSPGTCPNHPETILLDYFDAKKEKARIEELRFQNSFFGKLYRLAGILISAAIALFIVGAAGWALLKASGK